MSGFARFRAAASRRQGWPVSEPTPDLPPWQGMDGATAWLLIDRQAETRVEIRRMMAAWLEANRDSAPDAEAALAFVLRHGVPMTREGRYRYHGVTPVDWHDTPRAAIQAAMADPAFA